MAFPATFVCEVRTGGSDTQCSGAFNAARGGTDYTLQNAAQATGTVTSVTTTVTATTGIFTAAMVGNTITDGTTTKEITAFTSATIVTVDSAPSWTGATIFVGGAKATPGGMAQIGLIAGNVVFLNYNATPFTTTTASTNVSGGCVSVVGNTTWCGYDTTRTLKNFDANRPTFQVGTGVTGSILFTGTVSPDIQNIIVDGAGVATSTGSNHRGTVWRCKATNFTNGGIVFNNNTGSATFCEATGCSSVVALNSNCYFCVSHGNTITGISGFFASGCISYGNTGASSDGFQSNTGMTNCVAYGNGRDGFRAPSGGGVQPTYWLNCISENNTGFGFNMQFTTTRGTMVNCATYLNTSGRSTQVTATTPIQDLNPITGSGSFFNNAASADFRLNNTAGAGASARAAGFPSLSADGLTSGFGDVGAAQHQDSPAITLVNTTTNIFLEA